MIALIGIITMLAQAAPAPLLQNQAPVPQSSASLGIPAIPGIDRTFAQVAIAGNNAEVEMARLALRRSSAPEVKSFAAKMIAEHMGLADEMMPQLLRVLGGAPAAQLAPSSELALAHLATISDVDFDQVYAAQQVGDHLATLTAFRTEADSGTDAQLKLLARKWIPTLEAHLELAVSLTSHIGGNSPLKQH